MADYFGSTLTDLQRGMTATEQDRGATSRSRIAADAANKASYFNLLSNRAKTEADSRIKEAENAREYFRMNMLDAQHKGEVAARSAEMAKDWENKFTIQDKADKNAQERLDKELRGRETLARIQYPTGIVAPQLVLQREKAQDAQKEAETLAGSAAAMANQALGAAFSQFQTSSRTAWNAQSSPEARRMGVDQARQGFRNSIGTIQAGLGDLAPLVKFNPEANRFEPVFTAGQSRPVNMIPDTLDNLESREQIETEPPRMIPVANVPVAPRQIPTAIQRPAPPSSFFNRITFGLRNVGELRIPGYTYVAPESVRNGSPVPQAPPRMSKAERANQIQMQRPDLTREQIIAIVNAEFQ